MKQMPGNLALHHLGNVLAYLADLHPDDRCQAFDEALEYYNKHCPTRQIVPEFPGTQRLVSDPLNLHIVHDSPTGLHLLLPCENER